MSLSSSRMLLFPLLFSIVVLLPLIQGDDVAPEWCVADEQMPEDVLLGAMGWACGDGGANCSMIQPNQPCFGPNTTLNHASYAFNNYFQHFKNQGGSCYFNGAALVTDLDPSYDDCHFEYLP